jgi:hypothetical protein
MSKSTIYFVVSMAATVGAAAVTTITILLPSQHWLWSIGPIIAGGFFFIMGLFAFLCAEATWTPRERGE